MLEMNTHQEPKSRKKITSLNRPTDQTLASSATEILGQGNLKTTGFGFAFQTSKRLNNFLVPTLNYEHPVKNYQTY